MFMCGKVTPEEYDQIKAQGWEIMRRPLIREVDRFCDPSCVESNEKDQDAENFFVLVWVDSGIADNLTKWFNEEIREENAKERN